MRSGTSASPCNQAEGDPRPDDQRAGYGDDAAFAYGASVLVRPHARPKDAPAHVFSAERAMTHVKAIAREPHPAGSAAMAGVADYLARELEQLGRQAVLLGHGRTL